MTISLEEFHQDFFQEVMASADVDGLYAEDAFFELFCEYLADAGEFDTADRAPYCPPTAGIRIDGYAGDPAQSGGLLSLVDETGDRGHSGLIVTVRGRHPVCVECGSGVVESQNGRLRAPQVDADAHSGSIV